MIGSQSKSFLARTLKQQQRYGALVQSSSRGFAGGGAKKPAIDPACTDFDLVLVGKSSIPLFNHPIPSTKDGFLPLIDLKLYANLRCEIMKKVVPTAAP